jgi:hypothetical protein
VDSCTISYHYLLSLLLELFEGHFKCFGHSLNHLLRVVLIALEDVAEISPFLAIDKRKQLLVLRVQSAERDTGDLDCSKMNLCHK